MATAAAKPLPVYTTAAASNGHAVLRDSAPFKTPAGMDFILPTQALAEAIAVEWRAQGEKPNPASMPLTQLAATVIDIAGKNREAITAQLLAYIDSELLCHRAAEPAALAERQKNIWQPVLDWGEQHFDILLKTGSGIMPVRQEPDTHETLGRAFERYDAFGLTGLRHAVDLCGSLVLGLALAEQHMDAGQVFEASELDARFQSEKWGEDPATAKRFEAIRQDLAVCEKWFRLLKA